MTKEAVFIYSDSFLNYKFSNNHPFNQLRVKLTYELLREAHALSDQSIAPPRMALQEELELVHDPNYIQAVKLASEGKLPLDTANDYGLGTEDTPIFPNMHEASSWLVGGTLTAVDYVMNGKAQHALSLGGGLHHGFRGKASGFCIYNDSSVAIKYIQKKYGARVLYVDTDAHHGDGVQWTFYDDDQVCTFSIHETGRYLFPGTGNINERGHGKGYGYSFNIPLDAFTEDESWIDAYTTSLRAITEFFRPDVILTQNGADSHYYDPLTHLCATTKIYRHIPKIAHELAHQYCNGRWIAVGGGGYDIWRVVPRAWAFIWLEMTGQQGIRGPLPSTWLEKWKTLSPVPLSTHWDDGDDLYEPIPRKAEITEKNAQTVQKLLYPLSQQVKYNKPS
ncbi:acetoin utilization protein AcuC [Bacillus fengqiuensis]|nr:acetoin utilization protein AcuC [Bacillus fengqiuensis]